MKSDAPITLMLSGPTGIGKTERAIELAERAGLEIISADSMQVYKGLAIGTAQPTAEERRRARFHVCGEIAPGTVFNAREFISLCDAAHEDIVARGRRPIYVGGSGLYLRALRWGLFEAAGRDDAVRSDLEAQARREGSEGLHRRLREVDPEAARRIAPADMVRLVRALEVFALTGQPISGLQKEWPAGRARFPHRLVILHTERDEMRRRIERRADRMLASGWVEEVAGLLARGYTEEMHCFKALGYREIIAYLRGGMNLETLRQTIVTRTYQFARRQLTWFRREQGALWLDAGGEETVLELENLLANTRGGTL